MARAQILSKSGGYRPVLTLTSRLGAVGPTKFRPVTSLLFSLKTHFFEVDPKKDLEKDPRMARGINRLGITGPPEKIFTHTCQKIFTLTLP